MKSQVKRQVYEHMFQVREGSKTHHALELEYHVASLIQAGDMAAVKICQESFENWKEGVLSSDPLLEKKYLFCCNVALATRFAIAGGMDPEEAYFASDFFIQCLDSCESIKIVCTLHQDMFTYFTQEMSRITSTGIYSKPVSLCMEYIYHHIHNHIYLRDLSEYAGQSANYLCKLFKQETGMTLLEHITEKKMEAAKNMLLYSNADYSEISSTLAYSSQSYFIKVFKNTFGMTPRQFRQMNADSTFFNRGQSQTTQ